MNPRTDLWERWALGWRLLALLTLAVVAFAVASDPPPEWGSAPRFWALLAGFAAWYGCSIAIGRERLYRSLAGSLAFFIPAWIIWALLLDLHPVSYALAAILFPFTYSMLPIRRAMVFALVLSGLMFMAGNDWRPRFSGGSLLGGVLGVASSLMLALFIDSIIRQSEERKRLILELDAARASLAAAERQAGIMAERQRLAQQIHDTVAQGFVGIVTHLEAAEAALARGDGSAGEHISEAKAGARESLEEARKLVWDLRPDLRDGSPLPVVLQRHLAVWSEKSGVPGEQIVTGPVRDLDSNRETALLQAAREALNNVRTHAKATRVTMTLSYMEDEVALDVHDDGIGTLGRDGPAQGGGGFGLKALDERVRALRGQLTLESSPGDGTTLTVSLPLPSLP
jgi:signal transduction histidine kinase